MLSTLASWLPPADGILPYYMFLVRPPANPSSNPSSNPLLPPSS